nr:MAG TPA: protein of unknown function (DUF4355) [Caudoviricetes sp.]DAP50060.1 MAG TPA: protein of unknown function (DUF4355) [Caudoviricetes sp.]
MKIHLHEHPHLRFVDAADTPAGGEADEAQVSEAATETEQTKDWEAEAKRWKALSRQNEARAKENAEKARLFDEHEEQGKTELQKALDKAAQAEARVKALEVQAVRAQVAAAKGVDVDLLSGSTLEELEASADRLLAWRGAQIPKGAPASDAGHRGEEIRSSKQLTREDLKTMSAEQINQARRAGQLNDVMGLA